MKTNPHLTSPAKSGPRRSSVRFSFVFCVAFAALGGGCAWPHRQGGSSHVVEHFAGRPDGLLSRESWRDTERGGGIFLFTDPAVQSLTAIHTNQASLGGGSVFTTGSMVILVDSNLVPAIAATGSAAGNILGAAAQSALK